MKKILVFMVLLLPLMGFSAQLTLVEERAWLSAENESLQDVLALFEERGVEVLVDPSLLLKPVSGEWDGAKTERLIGQLVTPYSYVLEWKRVESPLGKLFQISTIRVFADGQASAARRLSAGRRILDVVSGKGGASYVRGEILVGFGEGAELEDLNDLLKKLGGSVIEVMKPPGVYRIKLNDGMSVEQAQAIADAHKGVKAAEPNLVLRWLDNALASFSGTGEGINLHLQSGERAIAVLDSGLDPQYANMRFIRGVYNALSPEEPMSDLQGHGTLMALVASGAVTPLGADPVESGAPVLAIRTFDEHGNTSSDAIFRAISYAANSGVDIINMSWGSNVDSQFLEAAMNYAAEQGIVLFASAGNEPTGIPIYPAGYSSVIAVGGLNPDGSVWEGSNFGEFVQAFEPAKVRYDGKEYEGTSPASAFAALREALKK